MDCCGLYASDRLMFNYMEIMSIIMSCDVYSMVFHNLPQECLYIIHEYWYMWLIPNHLSHESFNSLHKNVSHCHGTCFWSSTLIISGFVGGNYSTLLKDSMTRQMRNEHWKNQAWKQTPIVIPHSNNCQQTAKSLTHWFSRTLQLWYETITLSRTLPVSFTLSLYLLTWSLDLHDVLVKILSLLYDLIGHVVHGKFALSVPV